VRRDRPLGDVQRGRLTGDQAVCLGANVETYKVAMYYLSIQYVLGRGGAMEATSLRLRSAAGGARNASSAQNSHRNGAAPPCRTCASALSLFAVPLNGLILRALGDGPMRLTDLRREVGGPAQTTLRGNLAGLQEIGAIAKRGREGKPNVFEHELTVFGEELLLVAGGLEAWLDRAPGRSITFESSAAKAAIKAFVGGWVSTVVRALAARPLTLTELDRLIDTFTYPALERRLGAMRLAGQVERCPDGDRKRRPYTVTPWLREAVGPLLLAGRCERRHVAAETPPITRIDIEAGFLLAVALIRLPSLMSGVCQLAVEPNGGGPKARPVGVRVEVESGCIVSCVSRLEAQSRNQVLGAAPAWLDAVIERDAELLEYGGDAELGRELVHALHDGLFARAAESDSAVALAGDHA
jgi:DNA-binding HxlR family transcriptional regulator